jgi:ethanolamine utilization protein EutA
VVDADIAQAMGAILTREAGLRRRLIVIDGVELTDFDFIDVGEYQNPPGVLPVLIKSLLFAPGVADGRQVAAQAIRAPGDSAA